MFSRKFFAFICSTATAFIGAGERAGANDLQPGGGRANEQCAAFGPGFTAVDGADTCVWVGGHVRLEVGSRMASGPDSGWAAGGATPAAVRVNDGYDQSNSVERSRSREHVRVRDGDATGSIDPFR